MEIKFHRTFLKDFEKIPAKIKTRFRERIVVFSLSPFDPTLRNHSLTGEWVGRRSINITGDYRAIYKTVDEHTALFEAIGTHSKLYS